MDYSQIIHDNLNYPWKSSDMLPEIRDPEIRDMSHEFLLHVPDFHPFNC